jgi:hypothetical protein
MKKTDANQAAMNHVERFRAVMAFEAVDRLSRWEWAMWWDQAIDRWHGEGLPRELSFSQVFDIARYFGLDPYQQFWFSTTDATIEATQHHVEGMVSNMDDYLRIRPQLFPDHDSASVDHQTPPGVSLDQYRSYLRLLEEYTAMTG